MSVNLEGREAVARTSSDLEEISLENVFLKFPRDIL